MRHAEILIVVAGAALMCTACAPASSSSEAATAYPAPYTAPDGAIVTTNRLSTLSCVMVRGTDDDPTGGTAPTYTPAITVTNTSSSALNLQDYLGGAVTYDIWFLNSDGGVVYFDQDDANMGWPDSFDGTLSPGASVTYTAYYNSNIGLGVPAQEDMDQQPGGQSVTQCKAMFVEVAEG